MKSPVCLEVCCGSSQSALNAQQGGAHRVELCQNLAAGGVTPSSGDILVAREHLSIDLNVLIRPREGDFLYNSYEREIIKRDILFCKQAGVNGVVFGFLQKDGTIDQSLTAEMIALARPMKVTFHRAFDLCRNPLTALEQLIDMGVDNLLTSGQQPTAAEGAQLIRQLVVQAGDLIAVMPGSGIREHNLAEIISATGAKAFHVSARKLVQGGMEYQPVGVAMSKLGSNYEHYEIDPETIGNMMAIINNLEKP